MKKSIYLFTLFLAIAQGVFAQENKKVFLTGGARGLFYGDQLHQDQTDSVTIPKTNNGHVLVDLGVSIRPNKSTEIQGMVRVRNDYGGFWGSGVSFDVRQLYIKGIIANAVRYQLGDINYKLSKYTLMNSDQELISNTPEIFKQQTRIMNYDNFYYADSSWRQQGASTDFGIQFKKYISEVQFKGITSRVRTSDFNNINDRLFSAAEVKLIQSKFLNLGYVGANTYDIPGTSNNTVLYHNPIHTFYGNAVYVNKANRFVLHGEMGNSKLYYDQSTDAPRLNGRLYDTQLTVSNEAGWQASVASTYVSSDFRSVGAQTKRINFNAQPQAYTRIGNDQHLRAASSFDYMRETDAYNRQLSPSLMTYLPKYDNITPYGAATPNRQGYAVRLNYGKKDSPYAFRFEQLLWKEVKGEGTLNLKQFYRTQINASVALNKLFGNADKVRYVELFFRNDATKRAAENKIPAVDLTTQTASIGLCYEVKNHFDLLAGFQNVKFNGFDLQAIRNGYSQIYNFSEYRVHGQEQMYSVGGRYRFNEKSTLSLSYLVFKNVNNDATSQNYQINQLMLYYQMNF